MASDTEHLYIYLRTLCMFLLGEVSVQILCPFFNWVACLLRVESCEFFTYFGDQTLVWSIIDKHVFPESWYSFHFNALFFSVAEAFYFDEVSFVYSFLHVPCSRGHTTENIDAWNIWDFPASVLLWDFYDVTTYILVFYPPWIYFCVWWKVVPEFQFFACSCPALPIPFVEETIFAPFYAAAHLLEH